MDLFFYREPEEAKEQEADEGTGAPDFGVTEYSAGLGIQGDQWPGQADAQWVPDMGAAPAIAAVAGGVEWTASGQNIITAIRSLLVILLLLFSFSFYQFSCPQMILASHFF